MSKNTNIIILSHDMTIHTNEDASKFWRAHLLLRIRQGLWMVNYSQPCLTDLQHFWLISGKLTQNDKILSAIIPDWNKQRIFPNIKLSLISNFITERWKQTLSPHLMTITAAKRTTIEMRPTQGQYLERQINPQWYSSGIYALCLQMKNLV